MLMDLWTHSFLKSLRHANHVYWCICMKKLHVDGCLESLDFELLDTCNPCLMGRMTKIPFSGTMKRASDLLEIIHADACDPMRIEACGGYRYFLIFTDDLSRYGYIYLMKQKSGKFEKVQAISE